MVPNTEAQAIGADRGGGERSEIMSINCGGGPVGFFRFGARRGVFAQDLVFQGGKTSETTKAIGTRVPKRRRRRSIRASAGGNAPTRFRSARAACTVRLHFAEVKLEAGERKFNVDINGRRVLADFDIAAEAGKDKAVVKDFRAISPDAKGNIVIAFSRGSADEPKICGIQILKQKSE